MHITLPTSKLLFAAFFSFLRAITLTGSKIKTKTVLLLLLAFFCFSNTFGQTTDPFNAPGAGTWTAPFGVTSVTVEVWGAGGGGQGVGVLGTNGLSSAGGGGSGGGFVKTTYAVTAGTTYNFNIGAGGFGSAGSDGGISWFINATTIKAIGGKGAGSKISANNISGPGATAPTIGNIGGVLISTYGGNGASGVAGSAAGGGGSSAGNIIGNPASGLTGGIAPTNGYPGATAPGSNGTGTLGGTGAGGSGAKKGNGAATPDGGNGGDGQIKITYTCPTYSAGTNQTLAACAATATLAATAVSLPATGLWTIVSGSGSVTTPSSATSGITGIVPGTPLVLKWTVSNGSCGSSSNTVTITSPVGAGCLTYCAPTYATGAGTTDGIVNVTLSTLNNASAQNNVAPYYTFYSNLAKPDLQRSSSSTVVIKYGADGNQYGAVWIDFNQNGTFEASEGFLSTVNAGSNGISSITITVPASAVVGNTRMRVRGGDDSILTTAQACGASSSAYGETEDYIVNVIAPVACSAPVVQPQALVLTPSVGSIAGTFIAASPAPNNYLVVMNTTGVAPALSNGTTYAIGSTALGGTNVIIDNDSNTNFSATSINSSTTYYFFIYAYNICTGTPLYNSVNPLTGNVTSTVGYCIPSSTQAVYPISNVTFPGFNNNSTSTTLYYEDFSAIAGNVTAGTSYNISVTATATSVPSNVFYQYAFFDWNNNGDFSDPGETYLIGSYNTATATLNTNILIPVTTYIGKIRMRVANSFNGIISPCSTAGYFQMEDYSLNITAAPICTSPSTQPTALTLTPAATSISGSFTAASPAPQNYLVVMNSTGTAPTAAITNGTTYPIGSSIGVSNTVIDTDSNTSFTAGGLNTNTKYYFFVYSMNALCTGGPLYNTNPTVLIANTTTTGIPPGVCTPSTVATRNADKYISRVAFIGTQVETNNTSTFINTTPGYQDFTGLPTKAAQIQGEGVNMIVESIGGRARLRVWVDWNKNGVFENSELVYDPNAAGISSTFGFVIPTGTVPGNYRIRVRTFNSFYDDANAANGNPDEYFGLNFDACQPFNTATFNGFTTTQYGEAEDYLFTVVERCDANILSVKNGQICNSGTTNLSATGTSGTTEYRWYANAVGGSQLPGSPTTGSWSTPSITATTTYYVAAWNGRCETMVRKPVVAKVNPTPKLTFTPTTPEICGDVSTIAVSASGDNELSTLLSENFEAVGLGLFSNVNSDPSSANVKKDTKWINRSSTFVPVAGISWKPAISTGLAPNNFALATSDSGTPPNTLVENSLESVVLNSTGYLNLTLKMKFYYSRYFPKDTYTTDEFVLIQVSENGGGTWTTLQTITADTGIGTKFADFSYNLNSYINKPNLKIRILHHSVGSALGYLPDGVAVDDIEIYGEKPLAPSFTWAPSNPIQFYSDAAATIPYLGTPASTVYIKPTIAQMETYANWDVQATATLSNGCSAMGNISIVNNTRIWKGTTSDWNTLYWAPNTGVPTKDQCVIIRKPVVLGAGAEGFAKNVKIEVGGKLTIKNDQSLTVTDAFIKDVTVPAGEVLIESDGNLIQVNEGININSGDITAKRNVTLSSGRQQYNYLISPLEGQSLAAIYKDASGNPVSVPYVLYHNEATNKFYTSSGAYIKGRGLAVKEPTAASFGTGSMGATFNGKPTNGAFSYNIINSNTGDVNRGYNLIGNPYPSNIDLVKFYTLNGGATGNLSGTAYFWDSKANTKTAQEGDGYKGQSYGQLNMSANTGTAGIGDISTIPSRIPTRYVKTGQAFMVRSKLGSATINFNNTIRTNLKGDTDFFGKGALKADTPMDRYWLNLITPQDVASNIAVVYFAEGNNGFAEDDSPTMEGSDVVYSIVENENVSINGRSNFVNTDVIPLGTNHYATGNYTIALGAKEGIFASGQNIYLKDTQTGTLMNLSEGNYTFAANAGESTGRFEIIYQPETVLATDSALKEDLVVYRNAEDFVITAQTGKITEVEVYEPAGRLVYNQQPNSTKVLIPAQYLIRGVYLIKIHQGAKVTMKKVIR